MKNRQKALRVSTRGRPLPGHKGTRKRPTAKAMSAATDVIESAMDVTILDILENESDVMEHNSFETEMRSKTRREPPCPLAEKVA